VSIPSVFVCVKNILQVRWLC